MLAANRSQIVIGVLWLVTIGFGLFVMANYESSPGIAGLPPQNWPAELAPIKSRDKFTLVMFAHPRCPCTRASMSELAGLITACGNKMEAIVFFLSPEAMPKDWEKTDIWHHASSLNCVKVIPDLNGLHARLFNSHTSGQTALYDKEGKLVFSGGITSARGRIGNNQGVKIITSLVNRDSQNIDVPEKMPESATLVFGCPLHNADLKPR